MLPYLFIVFPFSLLFSMVSILMLILLVRSLLFNKPMESHEEGILLEKLSTIKYLQDKPSVNHVRFPEDYSTTEAMIYILCGIVLIWFVSLGMKLWNFVAPVFGCVFLATGIIIMAYDVLSVFFTQARHRYAVLALLGILICLLPLFLTNVFWIYRYSVLPAGLLCFFMGTYRLTSKH